MDDDQLLRYSRHVLLDAIGVEGQRRIRAAHALVVGAGGLGSPAALFLASAGIGTLTLCDADVVDLTNLQRQLLHDIDSLGMPKVDSARARLGRINPEVEVVGLNRRVDESDLDRLTAGVDIVLDCSDNFATRHAVNRASVRHARPLVSGAAIRFDGQVSVFDPRDPASPCYHCLFGEGEDPEETRCALMGVFAPLVGVVGSLQAAEALKLLVGAGRSLAGRLLLFDALSAEWRTVRVPRDPACPVCRGRR